MVVTSREMSEQHEEFEPGEKKRIMKNVVALSLAFMVHFTAYQGASNLQSSINADAGLGTASLVSVYAALILSNLFLPVVMIKWLGCKWTVTVSFITYMPYIVAQFYPRFYTLIPAGLSVGFGGGPLWCAKCMYLSVVGEVYSKISGIPADVLVVRFFGLFFMLFQCSQIWGNLISSFVLSSGETGEVISSIVTNSSVCGAQFVSSSDAARALVPQPPHKIRLIAGIYLACMVAACLIVAVGVDSLQRYEKVKAGSTAPGAGGCSLLAITLKLLKEPNQLLIIIITAWLGLGQTFMGADYTSAYVSCALGTSYVGYVMVAYGVANSASAITNGYIVKVTGRPPLVCCALVLQTGLMITCLLWRPRSADLPYFFVVAAVWGLCDGIWLVHINAFNGILFPGREEAAYSNFRLWESIGSVIAYVYSPYLRASVKLYVLLATLLTGVALYLVAEYRLARSKKEREIDCVSGLDNFSFNKSE